MKVYGQLERAQIEVLGADPSGAGLIAGRVWFNTVSKLVKYYDGTAVQELTAAAINADALAAAMSATGTGSIAGTMTTANANTIGAKITTAADTIAGQMTATGADAIAADISSTGTGSIVATATAANANTLINKRTRAVTTDGTDPGAGGLVFSAAVTTNTSSSSYGDFAGLSVTITTSGRPIFVGLVPTTSTSSDIHFRPTGATAYMGGNIKIMRDSSDVSCHEFYVAAGGGTTWSTTSQTFAYPPGVVYSIDSQSSGTYVYKVQAKAYSNTLFLVTDVRLVAYEL